MELHLPHVGPATAAMVRPPWIDGHDTDAAAIAIREALHERDPHQRYQIAIGEVSVGALHRGIALRSSGLDMDHVANLCKAAWPLTPILVHQPSMHVVDGHHRVAAAEAQGMTDIRAWLFDGPLDIAYTLAVRTNISHGLPLTLADRRAAAQKMLVYHKDWSDRAIAASTGLSAKVIGRLRRASEDSQQSITRLGRDGRRRPIDAGAQRAQAAEILAANPSASLREVARAVGLSPSTIHNLRARIEAATVTSQHNRTDVEREMALESRGHYATPQGNDNPSDDTATVLAALSRDPALRFNDTGRELLHWLHDHVVTTDDARRILDAAPNHSIIHFVAIARRCSYNWSVIAASLAAQQHPTISPTTGESIDPRSS